MRAMTFSKGLLSIGIDINKGKDGFVIFIDGKAIPLSSERTPEIRGNRMISALLQTVDENSFLLCRNGSRRKKDCCVILRIKSRFSVVEGSPIIIHQGAEKNSDNLIIIHPEDTVKINGSRKRPLYLFYQGKNLVCLPKIKESDWKADNCLKDVYEGINRRPRNNQERRLFKEIKRIRLGSVRTHCGDSLLKHFNECQKRKKVEA
jgi:hypothetical protein